jgi:hypothetical protein
VSEPDPVPAHVLLLTPFHNLVSFLFLFLAMFMLSLLFILLCTLILILFFFYFVNIFLILIFNLIHPVISANISAILILPLGVQHYVQPVDGDERGPDGGGGSLCRLQPAAAVGHRHYRLPVWPSLPACLSPPT